MAEIRFMKLFRGIVKYKDILEVENMSGLETIEAKSFPHPERNLHFISLIKIPPQFYGEISGRIAKAHVDLGAVWVQDTPNDITWLTFDKQLLSVTFPNSGEYRVEIQLDAITIHDISLTIKES